MSGTSDHDPVDRHYKVARSVTTSQASSFAGHPAAKQLTDQSFSLTNLRELLSEQLLPSIGAGSWFISADYQRANIWN